MFVYYVCRVVSLLVLGKFVGVGVELGESGDVRCGFMGVSLIEVLSGW